MNNKIWDTLINNLDLAMRQMDAAISKSRKQIKAKEYEVEQTLQSIPVPVMNRPLAIAEIVGHTVNFYATKKIADSLKIFGTLKTMTYFDNKYFILIDRRYNKDKVIKYLKQLEALLAAPTV